MFSFSVSQLKPLVSKSLDKLGITSALASGWRVLMYHRIIDPEKSVLKLQAGMYVRPETFRMQMQFLAENCNVISLHDLTQALLKKETLPKKTIAITFDDGWVDNYEFAFPILKELKLPATIFLPTEYIGAERLFWTDKFSMLSLLFREQEADVEFLFKNEKVETTLRKLFNKDSEFETSLEKSILQLKQIDHKDRIGILDSVEEFLQFNPEMLIPSQFLNWQQIKQMQEHKIDFGSHGHSHMQLGRCNATEVTNDVETSLNILKTRLKAPSKIFCYPEGSYSEISQAALAKLPIDAVVSNKWVKLKVSSPPIIGRIGIHQDISAEMHMFKNRIWCNQLF